MVKTIILLALFISLSTKAQCVDSLDFDELYLYLEDYFIADTNQDEITSSIRQNLIEDFEYRIALLEIKRTTPEASSIFYLVRIDNCGFPQQSIRVGTSYESFESTYKFSYDFNSLRNLFKAYQYSADHFGEGIEETVKVFQVLDDGKIIEPEPAYIHLTMERTHLEILSKYSLDELRIMRNTLYANHGYIFKTDKMKRYFSAKPWYIPRYDNVDHMLTDLERHNINEIRKAEKALLTSNN